jgi:hypothetical protein
MGVICKVVIVVGEEREEWMISRGKKEREEKEKKKVKMGREKNMEEGRAKQTEIAAEWKKRR